MVMQSHAGNSFSGAASVAPTVPFGDRGGILPQRGARRGRAAGAAR